MGRKPAIISKKGQLPRVNKQEKHRHAVLGKQLSRFGKVGGIKDSRLGVRDRGKSESEKSLHRQIVEKLRQMNDLGYEHDVNDPMNKAAFSSSVDDKMKQFQLDEKADGGIQGDVVDEEFFGSGADGNKFRDVLAEKIAVSKLEKMKRVEENEEQRDRVKSADSEWTNKMRFMLSQVIPKTKKKKVSTTASEKSTENKLLVAKLLEDLASTRRIAPVDRFVENSEDKRVLNLQSLLETQTGSITPTNPAEDDDDDDDEIDSKKTVGYLLRVLLRMPQHEQAVKTFVADQLSKARLQDLKDVVHHLLLSQLLVEHCEEKFRVVKNNPNIGLSQAISLGSYCPELVDILTRMWKCAIPQTASSTETPGPLMVNIPTAPNPTSDNCKLDIRWADPSFIITTVHRSHIQLACLNRMLALSDTLYHQYAAVFPSSVCAFLFDSMYRTLDQFAPIMQQLCCDPQMYTSLLTLLDSMKKSHEAPTPPCLTSRTRLTVLSEKQNPDAKLLKQFGLLPQLEPRIDEKIDARHPKKLNTRRILQRKVAKEKRGVMREIRRDGEYLAAHQLKSTKANDLLRNKKTQAILTSLRAIED